SPPAFLIANRNSLRMHIEPPGVHGHAPVEIAPRFIEQPLLEAPGCRIQRPGYVQFAIVRSLCGCHQASTRPTPAKNNAMRYPAQGYQGTVHQRHRLRNGAKTLADPVDMPLDE